jgi:membrane-associated protease RseP (regulator of RpoE activity)
VILPGPKPDEKPDDRRRRQMNSFEAPTQRVQNPSGEFELKRLAAGSHELAISTPAGESASHVVSVQAGEQQRGLRIQVKPGLRVTGRVVEYGSDKPIPGAVAMVMGTGGARSEGDVGPDGSFVVNGAPTGDSVRLMINADFTRYVGENKELEIKPGQTTVDAGVIKLLPGNQRERMMIDPAERGQVGAGVGQEQGRAVVRNVAPNGPAAKAGLAKGDVVVSIDGQNARDLGNGALSYLVQGKPGSEVTIVVESAAGGGARTVKLVREPSTKVVVRPN